MHVSDMFLDPAKEVAGELRHVWSGWWHYDVRHFRWDFIDLGLIRPVFERQNFNEFQGLSDVSIKAELVRNYFHYLSPSFDDSSLTGTKAFQRRHSLWSWRGPWEAVYGNHLKNKLRAVSLPIRHNGVLDLWAS